MKHLQPSPLAPWAEGIQKKLRLYARIDAKATALARRDVWKAEQEASRAEGQFRWRETTRGLTRPD